MLVGHIATYIAITLTYPPHVRKKIEYDSLILPSVLNITIVEILSGNRTKGPLKPTNAYPTCLTTAIWPVIIKRFL